MKLNWGLWLKGLAAAAVGGVSGSFLNALGITGAQYIGVQIEQLSPKQLLTTTIVGGLVAVALYFKQSPVPPDESPKSGV